MKRAHQEKVGKANPDMDKPSVFCGITSGLKSPCCTILESISDGVFTIDLNKRITSFNRAAETITGFKSAEAIGQYCFDVFRASICERQCALDQTLATSNSQVNVNAHIISRSGSQKAISISTATLRNEKNDVIGGVETFRDLSELERLKRQLARNYTDEDIVGRHPRMKEIFSFLPDIAESESSVLIEGPTGSGKELIARAIHQLSPRKTGPFVAVNCAALPETLSFLMDYAFPGNIRELENIIEFSFIACKGAVIGLEHLSRDLLESHKKNMPPLSTAEHEEAQKIRAILEHHSHNRLAAARTLGLSRTSLWRKMRKYGLNKP